MRQPPLWATLALLGIVGAFLALRLFPTAFPLLAVDTVVFLGPEQLRPTQQEALLKWVEAGGRLVFFTGRRYSQAAGSFWEEISPVEVSDVRSVDMGRGPDGRVEIVLAEGTVVSGRAVWGRGGHTLAAETRRGRGEIMFVALSHDSERLWRVTNPEVLWSMVLGIGARGSS